MRKGVVKQIRVVSSITGGVCLLVGLLIAFFQPDRILRRELEKHEKVIESSLNATSPTAPPSGELTKAQNSIQANSPSNQNAVTDISRQLSGLNSVARMMEKPPDWTLLHKYSVVLSLPSFAGGKPVRLDGEYLYNEILKNLFYEIDGKADSAFYIQHWVITSITDSLERTDGHALVQPFLQSELKYPSLADFTVTRQVASDGYSKLVYTYKGAFQFDEPAGYSLFFREGEEPSDEQQSAFLQQCSLSVALNSMKKALKSAGSGDALVEDFLGDPSERTLGRLLFKRGHMTIEVPDYDTVAASELQLAIANSRIALKPLASP